MLCRTVMLAALLLLPTLAGAQTPTLPARVDAIVRALYEANTALAHGNDEARRALTKKVAEQVRCELGDRWGWKSASPTRPPSKDAIARHGGDPRQGPLDGWDLFNGTTRRPIPGGIYHDLSRPTRQHFIAVSPVDHLGVGCLGTPTPPENAPPPPPPADDAFLEELRRTNALLTEVIVRQQLQADELARIREAIELAAARLEAIAAQGVRIRF